ncbi:putative late blight resistance protein R1A-10 [Salvia divinorum]|uniref:Late blight resistance protein R1A-10 n=1 Tax=Salvia divinorum TaxID=28513 RepID=A0ABD1FVH7_SALDI
MAYAAVISLRHSIERLVNPTIDPGITKSAYEELGGSQQQHQHQKDLDDEGVKEEIESFMKIAKKLGEEYNRELDNDEDADVSTIDDFSGKKSTVVGLSDQCAEIRDKLLDPESRCKIVSIVGMAGIGKTVLAREVHQDLIHHFDLTAWVSLGPTRRMEDVLVDVLSQIDPTASYADEDKHTLADCLYMILYGRKYFVVLDDIWNPKEWGYLMNFFPGNNNGCRLLLSTRLQKRLIMRHCYKMMEMPLQIENIPTLETIEIADCNLIIMLLAKSMKMRKESSGNDFFPVSVTSSLNLL